MVESQIASKFKYRAYLSRKGSTPITGIWYLIDPERFPNFLEIVPHLPAAIGVIYRHFGAIDKQKIAWQLRRMTWRQRQFLLIGNDIKLARLCRADGVHFSKARAKSLSFLLFKGYKTAAASDFKQAYRLAVLGSDMIFVSKYNPSSSSSPTRVIGKWSYLTHMQARPFSAISDRIVALGGVTAKDFQALKSIGGAATIADFHRVFGE